MESQVESDSDESWDEVETPDEAIEIFIKTVFEFASVILNLCIEAESKGIVKPPHKPSIKIRAITALLQLFTRERLIQHYVNFVLNWKDKIDNRNDRFFLENDHIYPGAPPEDIKFFRDFWRDESSFHLIPDEKEVVYEYFDTMLHFCEEWKNMTGFVAKWEERWEEDSSE